MLKTKLTLISYPHILKISLRSSGYGLRYSLKGKLRSKSKFTQQLIMNSCYLIAVVLEFDCHCEKNGLLRIFLVKRHFPAWYLQFSKFHEVNGIKSLRIKQGIFSILSIMRAKQCKYVNLEHDLKVSLRLLLRPHLLDLYEFFRICG